MTAQYDEIGAKFTSVTALSFRQHMEAPSVLDLVGPLEGKAVLDAACGEGMYSRLLKQRGAARVVGVDVSREMIRLAQEREDKERLGIEYLVHDVAELPVIGSFDAATAVYLLNYAETRDRLHRMCAAIYKNLREGAAFVTVVPNAGFDPKVPGIERYGYTVPFTEHPPEGSPSALIVNVDPPVTLNYTHWSEASYRSALAEAGFRDVTWIHKRPSAEGEQKFGRDFWQGWIDNPFTAILRCVK